MNGGPSIVEGPPNDSTFIVSAEDVVGLGKRDVIPLAVIGFIGPLISLISRYSVDGASVLGILGLLYLLIGFFKGFHRREKVERPAIALSAAGISWALSTGKWKQFPWTSIAKVDLKIISDKGHLRHQLSIETTQGEPHSIGVYDKLGKPVNFRQLAAQIANRVDPAVLGLNLQEILGNHEYLSDK